MAFSSLLDPLLRPLLSFNPLWALIFISFVVSVIITFCYKWFTDQEVMKTLKQEMKDLQKEMKQLKNEPKKFMAIQKKTMEKNMQYMGKSMKPTLVTFIPIIIVFGWLQANFAYIPVHPNEEFTTSVTFHPGAGGSIELMAPDGILVTGDLVKEIADGNVKWVLQGEEGKYDLLYKYNEESYHQSVLITSKHRYLSPVQKVKNSKIKTISVDLEKNVVMNLFGWKVGWLGTYIIFSLIFSMGLRKLLKLH